MKNLTELYKEHQGKVSDKWELYLREYDRLFTPYRSQPVALLEIGIQNGGSLEIWAKYFPYATKIIGCDINPDCNKLSFDDARVHVVVGDASEAITAEKIFNKSEVYDLIIDDGSHKSSDVVKAFAKYFPKLSEDGLFVAEDLHCSYWENFEGGLFHPHSSISFFKVLADVVNHDHWGIALGHSELINEFKNKYKIDLSSETLAKIYSIEFFNSLCVVKKKSQEKSCLGERIVAGSKEYVVGGLRKTNGSKNPTPTQIVNQWSSQEMAPKVIREKVNRLGRVVKYLQAEKETLRQAIQSEQAAKESATHELNALRNSRSWRYTSFFRKTTQLVRRFVRLIRQIRQTARRQGGYVNLGWTTVSVVRREGILGVTTRLSKAGHKILVTIEGGKIVDRNDYQTWIKIYDTLDEAAVGRVRQDIRNFKSTPKISILMPVYNVPLNFLEAAIKSVKNQIYENWEFCIADDASTDQSIRPLLESYAIQDPRIKLVFRPENGHISAASNSALELVTGDFVALLDNDDILPIHALYHVAKAISENPEVALIYSDEDKIDISGRRHDPYFKTDWNPDLIYSHNMFSHLGVYKAELLRGVNGFKVGMEGSQDYDVFLRCMERVKIDQILHLPFILYHWRAHSNSTAMSADAKPYAMIAGERAINAHFDRTGVKGRVELTPFGYRPHYDLPSPTPLVTIIIPTRNAYTLVRRCIDSIFKLSTYSNFEILLIDNDSDDPKSLAEWNLLEKSGIQILRDQGPFNYSALNNKAVIAARGEVIVLLNNDTEVVEERWLEIMVSHALRPGVGAVGGRLIYPNETVQHAGVILGLGGGAAGHAHYGYPRNSPGYFGRLQLTSNFSAVSAACLAVRRSLYLEFGGLNEIDLPVAFNDVDFCLRLTEAGYRTVYAADAVLYHHESATRGAEDNPEKLARFNNETDWMCQRWAKWIKTDPFYSPNLTLDHPDFSLAWPPRVSLY